jgi:hypothetical protein
MTKTEMFSKYLAEEGYLPKVDSDGDILFKREGLTFCIFAAENDREFFRLALPNIWAIRTEDERRKVLAAANTATGAVKVGKVFTVGDNVWATVELLIDPIENFSKVFDRSVAILSACVQRFREGMTK